VGPGPNIRSKLKEAAKDNYIYCGYLRHWNPDDLSARLGEDPLQVLNRQLVAMSRIARRSTSLWSGP
jgi:hypothetical protein